MIELVDMEIDIAARIGAVRRSVVESQHEGRKAHLVIAERSYGAGMEDVWDALTSAERIPRWLLPISGDLRLGGRYQLEGNAGGTITTCEPPQHLAVTWEFAGDTSWLDVHLAEGSNEGQTTLRLEHLIPDSPHWKEFGAGAVGIGWDLTLLGLGEHLASGEGVTEEGVAWAGSPQGLDFMRRSGTGWLEAALAGGAPEDEAGQQAAHTIAAYTEPPMADD
jgi:uncharacterized protein YndB with AHSA1/START domain